MGDQQNGKDLQEQILTRISCFVFIIKFPSFYLNLSQLSLTYKLQFQKILKGEEEQVRKGKECVGTDTFFYYHFPTDHPAPEFSKRNKQTQKLGVPGGSNEDQFPSLDPSILNAATTISILTFQHLNKWGNMLSKTEIKIEGQRLLIYFQH